MHLPGGNAVKHSGNEIIGKAKLCDSQSHPAGATYGRSLVPRVTLLGQCSDYELHHTARRAMLHGITRASSNYCLDNGVIFSRNVTLPR